MNDMKIDIVYLWVDSNDKKLQNERDFWAEKYGLKEEITFNRCRYIDNQELKYSLRSIEMYAPWINNIFIITNGQIPKWLDSKHPKIKIVKHDEIIPKECLPTFNSEAIETCIANIDELSEYFLCANDDKFFSSDVRPSDFFDENNNPIVKIRPQTWSDGEIQKGLYKHSYLNTVSVINNYKALSNNYFKYEPFHCIEAYRKSYYLECKKIFKNEFDATTAKRFRSKNSIQRAIIDLYMAEYKNCKVQINPKGAEQQFCEHVENLYLSIGNINHMREMINSKTPKLLCINDDELVQEENRKMLKSFLEELFPQVQPWEISEPPQEDADNKIIQKIYAIDNSYYNSFGETLKSLANESEFYEIKILQKNLSEENKHFLLNDLPANLSIELYDLNKLTNKTPYVEEAKLTEILALSSENEKIVFWGASLFLENIIKKYYLSNKNIIGIIDKNPNKHGSFLGSYKVYSPSSIQLLNPNRIIVSIINSPDERILEIKNFLTEIGCGGIPVETL